MLFVIQFLHPIFLYGLFALAIPIILHLFSFKKYKKVYFSNFNFLASLQQQKKNSSKLKNLLLLLLRLAAIAAIVVAFANPYTAPGKAKPRAEARPGVVIYADNSFSMSNTGTKGSLLEEAKKHLYDIVNTYPAGTNFIFGTNDGTSSAPLTKEEMAVALGGLKTTAASKTLSQVLKEAREATGGKPSTLFMISDFQNKNCDFQSIQPDSAMEKVFLVLKPENTNNLYIKDVVFDQAFHRKDQADKVTITLANASGREYNNVPVSLTVNGRKKSVSKVNIPAGSEKKVEISYLNTEDGFYRGEVEIADFPVVFDNKFYFSYGISGNTGVLCLGQGQHNPFFQKLFSDSTAFRFSYRDVGQTADVRFGSQSLIILDRINSASSGLESALAGYVQDGGNLFIVPGGRNTVAGLNRLLRQMQAPRLDVPDTNSVVAGIETQSAIFRDVFEQEEKNAALPYARQFYRLADVGNAEKLLTDKKGFPVLVAKPFGKGYVYLSAFDYAPENSDMVYHPLFVPLMVNMAANVNAALNTSYFLDAGKPVILNGQAGTDQSALRLTNESGNFEFIPQVRKDFSGNLTLANAQEIKEAGIYEVLRDGQPADVLAFNYGRDESEMEFCTEESLQKQFPDARVENIKSTQLGRNSELVKEIVLEDNNKYLTPWFILLAVVLLLLEQAVWRRRLM